MLTRSVGSTRSTIDIDMVNDGDEVGGGNEIDTFDEVLKLNR